MSFRRQKKREKVSINDLDWSDGEDCDEKYIIKQETPMAIEHDDDSTTITHISYEKDQSSLIAPERLMDHRRSSFNGYVKVDRIKRSDVKEAERNPPKQLNYPQVPGNVRLLMGDDLLNLIWFKFVQFGADESEMIQMKNVRQIAADLETNTKLPFTKSAILQQMESDDFVEFVAFVEDVAKNVPIDRDAARLPVPCQVCCAITSCRHQLKDSRAVLDTATMGGIKIINAIEQSVKIRVERQLEREGEGEQGDNNEKDDDDECGFEDISAEQREEEEEAAAVSKYDYGLPSEELRLNIVYNKLALEHQGRLRLKHMDAIMNELSISYDKTRFPQEFWDNQGELFIMSVEDLVQLVEVIRTDKDKIVDALADMFKYELPDWLREEFKPSEIMLYEHHFTLIDKDGGGSIDAEELQELVQSFGGKISLEDSQAMLDEYDMDGGGTIDFLEFMVLIYKIQRGTIDLTTSDLAQALVEAKAQLKIFEEIEEVSRHPPLFCAVDHFGGSPVTCDFLIEGAPSTPYENTTIKMEVIFQDGYPFRQPDIQFYGRVVGLNFLPQFSGNTRLMHIKDVWTAEWSIQSLLQHVVELLREPEPDLLPDHLFDLYSAWKAAFLAQKEALQAELLAVVVAERLAREAKEAEELRARETEQALMAIEDTKPDPPLPPPAVDADIKSIEEGKSETLGVQYAEAKDSFTESHRAEGKEGIRDDKKEEEEDVKTASAEEEEEEEEEEEASTKDEIPADVWAVRWKALKEATTIDSLSDDRCRLRITQNLSRIDRMHLPIILAYVVDSQDLYSNTIATYMQRSHAAAPDIRKTAAIITPSTSRPPTTSIGADEKSACCEVLVNSVMVDTKDAKDETTGESDGKRRLAVAGPSTYRQRDEK